MERQICIYISQRTAQGESSHLDLGEKHFFKLLCSFKFHRSHNLSHIALQFNVYLSFIHSSVLICGAMNPLTCFIMFVCSQCCVKMDVVEKYSLFLI